jgi:hypothetical protein
MKNSPAEKHIPVGSLDFQTHWNITEKPLRQFANLSSSVIFIVCAKKSLSFFAAQDY